MDVNNVIKSIGVFALGFSLCGIFGFMDGVALSVAIIIGLKYKGFDLK